MLNFFGCKIRGKKKKISIYVYYKKAVLKNLRILHRYFSLLYSETWSLQTTSRLAVGEKSWLTLLDGGI